MQETAHKLLAVCLISMVSACATPGKDELLPQDGPTMEQVYRNHVSNGEGESAQGGSNHAGILERQIKTGDADWEGYTRNAGNEIQSIFPRLPNPTLVMYVYPHLSTSSRLPVPGYSTSFPMYDRPEYALPGEL